MKTHVQRSSILITPECPQDVAFINDTLGLKVVGDFMVFRRVVVPVGEGVGGIIGLETVRVPESTDAEPPADPAAPTTVQELVNGKPEDGGSEEGGSGDAA